jgi:hypothetical protein
METTLDPVHTSASRSRLKLSKATFGWLISGLPLLFLACDGLMKFLNLPEVVEASAKVGFQRATLPLLGAVEVVSVILISLRRTAPFGAVLISAYLGGAVATHVRLGDPLLTHTLMPVYFAALIWGGLYLRDARVRALNPFKG